MKKILPMFAALLLVIPWLLSAFAETSYSMPDIEDKDLSLTIAFIAHNDGDNTPVSGAEFSVCKVADLSCTNGNAEYKLLPEYISLAKIVDGRDDTFNGITASESLNLAGGLVSKTKKYDRSAVTDKEGVCVFKDLEQGMYLVRETNKTGISAKYSTVEPYLISLPLGYATTTNGNYWQYDVLSEPKTVVRRLPDTDSENTDSIDTNTDTDSEDTNTDTNTDSVDTDTDSEPGNTSSTSSNTSSTSSNTSSTSSNTSSTSSNTSSTSSNTSSTSSNTSSTSSNTSSTSSNTSSTSSNTSSTSSNPSLTSSNTSSISSSTSSTPNYPSSTSEKESASNTSSPSSSFPSRIENTFTSSGDSYPDEGGGGGGGTVVAQYDTSSGIPDKVKTGVVMGLCNMFILLCASLFTILVTSKRRQEDTDN